MAAPCSAGQRRTRSRSRQTKSHQRRKIHLCKIDISSSEQSYQPSHFYQECKPSVRHRTGAILTSPQRKGATRSVLSPPERQTRELAGFRCFRLPPASATPELAPERWLSTRRIITPQLAVEPCFSTPLAQITLPLELTRLSITTAVQTTTQSAQMRSLVMSAEPSTTPMVVTRSLPMWMAPKIMRSV